MIRNQDVRLTPEGTDRQQVVREHIRQTNNPEMTVRIPDANEHGDISDNSEYEDLKEEVVMTDARITELEFLLDTAEIVEPPSGGTIGLGSTVTIVSDDGESETWRLVSQEEADTRSGAISTDSPVGSALVGHKKGDKTTVETPGGAITYTVQKVA
jgi:transcription elongation factor GreA